MLTVGLRSLNLFVVMNGNDVFFFFVCFCFLFCFDELRFGH